MERVIKFRAWDTFNERMVEEPYRFRPSTEHDKQHSADDKRYDAPFQFYESWQDEDDGINRPCFIMQFTGLQDKNKVDIYEGDVYHHGDPNITYVVEWHDCGLIGRQIGNKSKAGLEFWLQDIVVIGNRYQHPELLTNQ